MPYTPLHHPFAGLHRLILFVFAVLLLLIRFNVWFGPSIEAINSGGFKADDRVDLEAFATRLSLAAAIHHVRAYEEAYRRRYAKVTAVNFTLIGVDEISDLDAETLQLARVKLIEDMPTEPDGVGL